MTELTAEVETPGSVATISNGAEVYRVHYELYPDEGFAGMHKGIYCAIERCEIADEDDGSAWLDIDERDMNAAFGLRTMQPYEVHDAILEAERRRSEP